MSSILADKYNNENFKNILNSKYTEITNTEELLELELTPKNNLDCKEIFLFKDFLEKEENRNINLKIKYDKDQSKRVVSEWDEIVKHITRNKPIMQAMLNDSKIELIDKNLTISLPLKGANFLCQNHYDKEIINVLENLYTTRFNLRIKDEIDHEYCNTITTEIKEKEEELANTLLNNINNNGNSNNGLNDNNSNENLNIDNNQNSNNINQQLNTKKIKKSNKKSKNNGYDFKNDNIDFSVPNIILGKPRKTELKLENIINLNEDSGMVRIEGTITSFDSIEIKNDKAIVTINIYDGTYSIYSKSFVSKSDVKKIEKRLKDAKKIRIYGKTDFDKYSNELIVKGYSIFDITDELNKEKDKEKEKIKDKNINKVSEKQEKTDKENKKDRIERVELTAHTHMSMLEGLISAKNLIKTVEKNNMKAIGITDTSVVQAYPDIMYATMDKDIKPIYGLKGVLAADSKSPLSLSKNQDIQDSTYCILDIETTGFSFRSDKITELAILKYKNGKIIDTYETFVDPEMEIPEEIVKFTGITNEMVKGAPKKEVVAKKLIDFIGDSILVAHNADFDIGFIKYIAEKMNINIENTYIDTVILARILYPELSKFNQGAIAKHLNIKVEVAHRALDDVKTLTKIFENMLKILNKEKIEKWDDINKKIDADEDAYKRAQTFDFTALSKTEEGLRQIYFLVSDSHVNHYYFRPRILKSLLALNRSGLLLGSGNYNSELYDAIMSGKTDEEIEEIMEFYDFIEVQPVSNHNYLLKTEKVEKEDDLRGINKKIIKLADKIGKIVVATGDVHILKSEDVFYKEILDVSRKRRHPEIQNDTHFRTTDEMLEEFSYLGKDKAYEIVVTNTNKIADMCELIRPISENKATPQIENGDQILKDMCYKKAEEMYGKDMPDRIRKRIDKELNSIISNGYSALYLLAEKLVRKSNEDGYIVGSRRFCWFIFCSISCKYY